MCALIPKKIPNVSHLPICLAKNHLPSQITNLFVCLTALCSIQTHILSAVQ